MDTTLTKDGSATLTKDDVAILTRHFTPGEHEFRNNYTYITESAIANRIEEVDPAWRWEILNEWTRDILAICSGRLTIHGVSRDGQLGNTNASKYVVDARGNVVEKTNTDIISIRNHQHGTSSEYAYTKLADEAYHKDGSIKNAHIAAIEQRVSLGEITPHAGMVEAGFRVRKVAVNMEDANSAAATLMRHMDRELLIQLIDILQQQTSAN